MARKLPRNLTEHEKLCNERSFFKRRKAWAEVEHIDRQIALKYPRSFWPRDMDRGKWMKFLETARDMEVEVAEPEQEVCKKNLQSEKISSTRKIRTTESISENSLTETTTAVMEPAADEATKQLREKYSAPPPTLSNEPDKKETPHIWYDAADSSDDEQVDVDLDGGGMGNKIDFAYLMANPVESGEMLRASLLHFIVTFHRHIYFQDFVIKRFHLRIIKKLEDIAFGRNTKKNLYIGIAPRMGKTAIMSYFMAWSYTLNPHCNFIATSYGESLIHDISKNVQTIIDNDLYRTLFGIQLKSGSTSKELWDIDGGGKFRAAPLGGVITGFGAGVRAPGVYGGCLLIDDFLNATNATSEAEKQRVIHIYTNTLKSRLNKNDTPIIIIAQRLAQDDLIGYIQNHEMENWDFVTVKTLRDDGTSIWEDRISAAKLKEYRDTLPFLFWSQYQQEPIILGGDVIRGEWFAYHNGHENYIYKKVFIAADTAFKATRWSDNSAFGLWGVTYDNRIHLIDMLHGKIEARLLLTMLETFVSKYRRGIGKRHRLISCIVIEDAASGQQLIQEARIKLRIPIEPINTKGRDKFERLSDALPTIGCGGVYLPNDPLDPVSRKVIAECESYRAGEKNQKDDIVDMLAHAVNYANAVGDYF